MLDSTFEVAFIGSFAKAAAVSFVALFPAVNPLGSAPIFHGFTGGYPRSVQRTLARKVAFYGSIILVVSLLAGVKLLAFLGVSLSAIQVAGGLVVAHSGWKLLHEGTPRTAIPESSMDTALGSAFYPLTLPLTVGPGSISVAITLGAHLTGANTFEMHIAAILGMIALCVLVWAVYDNAYQLAKILGPTGTNVMVRLSSFALLALGIQIMWNGAKVVLTAR
jgi:multiple antibiotic resistance protein